MPKIILYIAVSADGFIADKNGSVDWLEKYNSEDYGYQAFYASIDTLVFGKNTYKQVVSFGQWPYLGKMSYVFTDEILEPVNSDIQMEQGTILEFMKHINELPIERLWLMGGAQLAKSFYDLNLIDEIFLFVMPEKIGAGIALSQDILDGKGFEQLETKSFLNKVELKHFSKYTLQ